MSKKVILVFVFSSFILTMCKTYASEQSTYTNGLSCSNYTDHRFFEWRGEEYNYYLQEEGADCSYTCPDGTTQQTNISGTVSSMYSASKAELDAQFCGVVLEATATEAPTEPPTLALSPTLAATPTAAASQTQAASSVASPTAQAAVTAEVTAAAQGSLLTGRVTMCDTGGKLISFRITQPPPDLSGKTLTAKIGGQDSVCYVNATNPSLMTCTLPADVVFPAPVIVSVDGVAASEFTYNGLGCAELTTPIATTTP